MFEIFGIYPLVKILIIVFILFFLSFFIGKIYTQNYTSNIAIQFLIGILIVVSLIAIITSLAKTIFLVFFILIIFLLKPSLEFISVKGLKLALKSALKLVGLFLLFTVEELFRNEYFSNDFILTGYTDYTYYLTIAENLIQNGVESPFNYMVNYGIESSPSLYHYFDIYILVPFLYLGIPPTMAYLYFYPSFVATFGVLCLVHMFKMKTPKWVAYLLAIVSIHIVGLTFSFDGFQFDINRNIIYFHKGLYAITLILILIEWVKSKNNLFLFFAISISILFNIILLPIMGFIVFFIVLIYKKRFLFNFTIKSNLKVIIGIFIFLLYFIFFYFINITTTQSGGYVDNSFVEKIDFFSIIYVENVINNLIIYIGWLKWFFIVFSIILIYQVFLFIKNIEIDYSIIIIFLLMIGGIIFRSLLYFNFFSHQIFNISFVGVVVTLSFYGLIQFFEKNKLSKYIASLVAIFIILGFYLSNLSSFHVPISGYKASVLMTKKTLKLVKENTKLLYFEDVEKATSKNTIRFIPYMSFEVGPYKLNYNVSIIQPTHTNLLPNKSDHLKEILTLIESGPFQQFCIKNNYNPESYYDDQFFEAVKKFISENDIKVLIFNNDMVLPEWINKLKSKQILLPINPKYDNHTLVFLDVD